jgi:hypothetical protein
MRASVHTETVPDRAGQIQFVEEFGKAAAAAGGPAGYFLEHTRERKARQVLPE